MLQQKWILELKREVTKKRRILILSYFLVAIALLCLGFLEPAPWLFVTAPIAMFVFLMGIVFAANIKIKTRSYNDNVICLFNCNRYARFYINGILFDEGGMFDYTYYGQLPTGEEVIAQCNSWTGSISIHVGSTTNNQSIHLS